MKNKPKSHSKSPRKVIPNAKKKKKKNRRRKLILAINNFTKIQIYINSNKNKI